MTSPATSNQKGVIRICVLAMLLAAVPVSGRTEGMSPYDTCKAKRQINHNMRATCILMEKLQTCNDRGLRHPFTSKCLCHWGWNGEQCTEQMDVPKKPAAYRASGDQDRLLDILFSKRQGLTFLEAGATVGGSNTMWFEEQRG